MANYYDPYGRRPRPMNRPGGPSAVTMTDYQKLAQAYQQLERKAQELAAQQEALQVRFDAQAAELRQTERELQIKNDALHQQSVDFKEMESELLFANAAVEQLRAEMAESEAEDWRDKYARLQAEMENQRRRSERRADQRMAEAKDKLLLDMLPLADHLDLALAHAADASGQGMQDFVANIEATRQAFWDALRRHGVERIFPLGEPFDPSYHEALGQIDDGQTAADHVAQVVQAGYQDGERVIRPARVLVSNRPAEPALNAPAVGATPEGATSGGA